MKRSLLLFTLIFSSLSVLQAQTWTWDGGGDGTTWEDPLNWDKDLVPPIDSFVTFIGSDTITGADASIMKLSVGENGSVLLNLNLTIGDGTTAEHNVVANSQGTLRFGANYNFTLLTEKSKNGFSTFASTENANIIIESMASVSIIGANNGINNASPSSTIENRGDLMISDSKNSINNKLDANFINSGNIVISNPGAEVVRGIISLGTFINETSGEIIVEKANKDCIELKGDTLFNHGEIRIILSDEAASGDNGIAVGTASDAAVLVNGATGAILGDGGIGPDGRAIYVYEAGKLFNYGNIDLTGGNAGSRFYTRGESVNELGGKISLSDGRINVNDGSFTNNGLILSTRQGSGIFNTATATNNAFFQYDSIRTFAAGDGIAEDNGINLRDSAEINIDFEGGLMQDVAEVSYDYYEGSTLVGSSDATGLLTLISGALSSDPAVISPEGLPEVQLSISNIEASCDETTSIEESICMGSTYDFNGQEISIAGVYLDTINVDGCQKIEELTLSILLSDTIMVLDTICAGDSLLFIDDYITIEGTYEVLLTNSAGCDSIVILELAEKECTSSSVENEFISTDFTVYPNPITEVLNVEVRTGVRVEAIEIINNNGSTLMKLDGSKLNGINLQGLPQGFYLIRLQTDSGVLAKKVFKI